MTALLLAIALWRPALHAHCRVVCPGGHLYCYGKCIAGADVPDVNPGKP